MAKYDVVGIGNALVDVVVEIEKDFLKTHDLPKGGMILVDLERSHSLYNQLPAGLEISGGSCGNTMSGLATLGGTGAYIGKVRNDAFGEVFRHDMRAIGIDFQTPFALTGPATGKCLVLVTPDAERTMCSCLGAAGDLSPKDVSPALIQSAKIVYLEGYLFDREEAKRAFIKAAEAAQSGNTGTKVALSLSDSFCVDRHRESFLQLMEHHVDILFANRQELPALYQTTDFDAALAHAAKHCQTVCITDGAAGSVLLRGGEKVVVPVEPVERVVDTTGAGDQYAAGVLYGLTRELPLSTCGHIGSIMGAATVSRHGARTGRTVQGRVAEIIG